MVTEIVTPELVYVTINSEAEWKQWYKSVTNKTYVISHSLSNWHVERKIRNKCILHERIQRRFSEWAGSQCLIRHDASHNLWVTMKLLDNFCIRGCGRRIKSKRFECMSCLIKGIKAARPFYNEYRIKEVTVLSQDFEQAYRLFKYMDKKDKLIVHHLDCQRPERCYHFKGFINSNRKTLPSYLSKVQGSQTEMVKILK